MLSAIPDSIRLDSRTPNNSVRNQSSPGGNLGMSPSASLPSDVLFPDLLIQTADDNSAQTTPTASAANPSSIIPSTSQTNEPGSTNPSEPAPIPSIIPEKNEPASIIPQASEPQSLAEQASIIPQTSEPKSVTTISSAAPTIPANTVDAEEDSGP